MTISSLFVTLFTLSTATAAPLMPGASRPAGADTSLVEKVAEGFSSNRDAAPEAVKRAWNSTYILISEKTLYKGTAFVVASAKLGSMTRLYYMTNWHVADELCRSDMSCPSTVLARNVRITGSGTKIDSMDIRLHSVRLIRSSHKLDLALIAVDVNSNSLLPTPIQLSSDCHLTAQEPLFSVGFPNISRRVQPLVPIDSSNVIQKRWSRGLFVKYDRATDLGVNVEVTSSTVDFIPGQSGGPLLNQDGDLVGVMRSSAGTKENGYRYDGSETSERLDWHSDAVRCEYLADFINGGVEIALQR